jgi:putative hydrolase of the HAD superfamily
MAIRAIVFDLDNTLYPAASGVMQHIDRRIGEYVQQRLGISTEEALKIRRTYCETFGTTLRGLLHHYTDIETEDYLRFVHDVEIEVLLRFDAALDAALTALPVRKVIFTNSPREHAERVLQALELMHHFERIFDLRYFNLVGKPDPASYQHVLEYLGIPGTDVLMLEDSAFNLPPAKALGMTTILIGETLPVRPDADYYVGNVLEALDIAQTLVASDELVASLPSGARAAWGQNGQHKDA